ncbi:MAG: transposase [Culturomica sp.]|nr:transposase [Culturomica sp.]
MVVSAAFGSEHRGECTRQVGQCDSRSTVHLCNRAHLLLSSSYEAQNCSGCPLRCLCLKTKGNRRIEVKHNLNRLKAKARE